VRYFVKLRCLLLVPLFFMLPGCGLMTSVDALLPPVENGTAGSTYKFRISDLAWADDGGDYVYSGIEVYYKIYTAAQSGSVISLSYSNQLASYGFKRLYREGDTIDNYALPPVLNIEEPEPNYKDNLFNYGYIDFKCYFDDINGTLTVTFYDDNENPILRPPDYTIVESFELKRSISFLADHVSGKEYHYKGFNEFEETDADIDVNIWANINPLAGSPQPVWLMLYAFSYGYSLDPNHMWAQIESPLEYLGQLEVLCQKYE